MMHGQKNIKPSTHSLGCLLAPDAVWTALKKVKSLAYAYTMILRNQVLYNSLWFIVMASELLERS